MEKQKVIVYVDGYNFYYGLRNGKEKWRRAYWLDVVKFFERMMQGGQELVEVHYYYARPLNDSQAYDNQDELSMLPDEITLDNGHIVRRPENWK